MQDDDILQDYLIESRDLLEKAQEDALRLESNPEDNEILASVFRAFHTIKGGAGFIEADNLVEWTHHLEDLLDKLRSHTLPVTSEAIDTILKGLDVVDEMFNSLAEGRDPEAGPAELSALIRDLAAGHQAPSTPVIGPTSSPVNADVDPKELQPIDEVDAEFEALLTAAQSSEKSDNMEQKTAAAGMPSSATNNSEITEDEFEALLDALHGPSISARPSAAATVAEAHTPTAAVAPPPLVHNTRASPAPKNQSPARPKFRSHSSAGLADKTLRVDAVRMDAAMNQVGEIVLLRNRLNTAISTLPKENEMLKRIAREIDLAVNDMQNTTMQLRMQPCKRLFQQLPRVVRDVSRNLAKEVELSIEGEEVEIDKSVVDALSAPLIHLVRNSLDHGIENPEDRKAAGKPTTATLRVAAIHLGDKIRVEVADDGRGIDRHLVIQKAIEKDVISAEQAAHLSDQEALELIFRPGFSTKDQASDLSGRGVGMDVVKETVRDLRGRIDLQTQLGLGTTIAMEFPLTMAILPVLYLRIRRDIYALPISSIESLVDITPQKIHTIKGRSVFQISNGQVVPLVNLGQLLYERPLSLGSEPIEGVLTEKGLFMVSEVLGNEDAVVKPIDFLADDKNSNRYQGATISGQGEVVLILDPNTLVALSLERMGGND